MRKMITLMVATSMLSSPSFAADTAETGILAALGLTAATGKTQLAEGGGQMEGVILAAPLLKAAAIALAEAIEGDDKDNLVVLGADEVFDISLPDVVRQNLVGVAKTANSLSCPHKQGGKAVKGVDNAGDGEKASATQLAAAAIGALKVDTSLSSFDAGKPEKAQIAMVAMKLNAVVPSEISVIPDSKSNAVLVAFNNAESALIKLEGCKEAPTIKPSYERLTAKLQAIAAEGDKGAPSPLQAAAKQWPLTEKDPLILRVQLEKVGGTIVNRSNIFIQFGFPGALKAYGALKLNYWLIDPKEGKMKAVGSILCRQPKGANLSHIYKDGIPEPSATLCTAL